MKFQIALFAALVAVALAAKETKPAGGYTTKFDNVDLDQILASDRLLKNYHKCLMEKGPCTPDGTELKSEYLSKPTKKFPKHYLTLGQRHFRGAN